MLIISICLFYNKGTLSSQIVDYEAELLIDNLIKKIKNINNFNKKINYKIYIDNKTNAFVTADNTIYISSSLIENSPDYIALMGVLAHEIGHIHLNHITQRKSSIKSLKKVQNLGSLSIIAGSLISNNPEMLQSLIIGSGSINNIFLNFSKDQEREADYYSIETLNNLNKSFGSVISLLKIIEKEANEIGFNEEMQKYGTHPLFSERFKTIEYEDDNNLSSFDNILNNNFLFIQSKFIGFGNKLNKCIKLEKIYKIYCESIIDANNGQLKNSLEKINDLISRNKSNIFLIETKADILLSYGYTNEAIKFYEKVFTELPGNKYVQVRLISNIDIKSLNLKDVIKLFDNNLNILYQYYNNKKILLKYLEMSKKLDKKEWIDFLEFWTSNNDHNNEKILNKIENFNFSKDKDLVKLLNIIKKNY